MSSNRNVQQDPLQLVVKVEKTSKLTELDYALQLSEVNSGINLGTTSTHRIDLGEKKLVLSAPMHCLTSLKIVGELRGHSGAFSASCISLLFLECLTYLILLTLTCAKLLRLESWHKGCLSRV